LNAVIHFNRWDPMTTTLWQSATIVLLTAAAAAYGTVAQAQTQQPAKPQQPPKAQQAPKSHPTLNAHPAQKKPAQPESTEQAVLLGQFGDWGAYQAAPDGKKVCFALSKPTSAQTEPAGRKRDPSYAFVSTRPAEKVKNEVSMIVGYPQKPGIDATATIGAASYMLYTQEDGAWIKNAAEEAHMVEAMRKSADLVIKSVSMQGTKTTDTYSLKGLGQALDKVAEECK
jgi:invasion protein IalB